MKKNTDEMDNHGFNFDEFRVNKQNKQSDLSSKVEESQSKNIIENKEDFFDFMNLGSSPMSKPFAEEDKDKDDKTQVNLDDVDESDEKFEEIFTIDKSLRRLPRKKRLDKTNEKKKQLLESDKNKLKKSKVKTFDSIDRMRKNEIDDTWKENNNDDFFSDSGDINRRKNKKILAVVVFGIVVIVSFFGFYMYNNFYNLEEGDGGVGTASAKTEEITRIATPTPALMITPTVGADSTSGQLLGSISPGLPGASITPSENSNQISQPTQAAQTGQQPTQNPNQTITASNNSLTIKNINIKKTSAGYIQLICTPSQPNIKVAMYYAKYIVKDKITGLTINRSVNSSSNVLEIYDYNEANEYSFEVWFVDDKQRTSEKAKFSLSAYPRWN